MVVIVVVVSAVVLIGYHSTWLPASTPHVGMVTDSQVSGLAGVPLTEIPIENNFGGPGSLFYSVTAYKEAQFNASGNSSFVVVISFEFPNSNISTSFYGLYSRAVPSNANLTAPVSNSSFDGFNFTIIQYDSEGFYSSFIVGHSGSFAFQITIGNIPSISPMTIAHDEIQAMTG